MTLDPAPSTRPVPVERAPAPPAGPGPEPSRRAPRWRRILAFVLLGLAPVVWLLVLVSATFGRIDNTIGYQSAADAGFALLAAVLPLMALALLVPARGPVPVVVALLVPAVCLPVSARLFEADQQLRAEVVMPWTCGSDAETVLSGLESSLDGGDAMSFEKGGFWDSGRCTGQGITPLPRDRVLVRATELLSVRGAATTTTDDQGLTTIHGRTATGGPVTITVYPPDGDLPGTMLELAVDDPGPPR